MGTSRKMKLPPLRKEKGPNGRPLCRWCGQEVPKGRKSWCSEDCVEQYRIRAWPGHARKRVKERDGGVCAVCGLRARDVAKALNRRIRRRHLDHQAARDFLYRAGVPHSGVVRQHRRNGWGPPGARASSLWQADHIVPVVEGGGGCGLDNLRTLCLWCHRRETKALRARLKKRRADEL